MQTRYSTALGFLAAASLLSGSAFAFAPEFVGDLPTVIITDKVSGQPNAFDPNDATTQYLFRYPDAFDLSSSAYVNPGSSATINDVRFLFNEYADLNKDGVADSPASPELAAQHTLLINDTQAFATPGTEFPLGSTEFATAPQVGLLDFRNIDFSPAATFADTTGIPFDAVGNVTGHNLTVSGSQFRVVQLYINTNFATQAPDVADMLVITELGTDDRLTDGVPGLTDPFTPLEAPSFVGWELGGTGLLATLPQPTPGGAAYVPLGPGAGTFTGYTVNPVRDLPTANTGTADPYDTIPGVNRITQAGTTSLSTTSSNASVGYVRWSKVVSTYNIAANQLLRFRLTLQSADTSATSKEAFLVGQGSLKLGQANRVFFSDTCRYLSSLTGAVAPEGKIYNVPAAPGADFDSYIVAEAAATDADGSKLAYYFDVLSIDDPAASLPYNTNTRNDLTATAYSIATAPAGRSYLTGKNVLLNRGNPTVPASISGEILTPESGSSVFTFGSTPSAPTAAGQVAGVGATGNPTIDPAVTMAGTANALSYTITGASVPSGASVAYPDFRSFSFYNAIADLDIEAATGGHFRATNGKLYLIDVWASTTTPTSTNMPILRVNTNFGQLDYEVTTWILQSGFFGLNAGVEAQSAPRAYTSAHLAQLGPSNTEVPGFVSVEFQQPLLTTMNQNANVTIHRITVTEYDKP